MARKTQGKPEDQEQSAAPQAGADSVDSAQQAASSGASQSAAQSEGADGNQAEPPPVPEASAGQAQSNSQAEPEPLFTFVVTDRTDVLHNDKWYREGDPIELNETDSKSLFKNGCIKRPKDDAK